MSGTHLKITGQGCLSEKKKSSTAFAVMAQLGLCRHQPNSNMLSILHFVDFGIEASAKLAHFGGFIFRVFFCCGIRAVDTSSEFDLLGSDPRGICLVGTFS